MRIALLLLSFTLLDFSKVHADQPLENQEEILEKEIKEIESDIQFFEDSYQRCMTADIAAAQKESGLQPGGPLKPVVLMLGAAASTLGMIVPISNAAYGLGDFSDRVGVKAQAAENNLFSKVSTRSDEEAAKLSRQLLKFKNKLAQNQGTTRAERHAVHDERKALMKLLDQTSDVSHDALKKSFNRFERLKLADIRARQALGKAALYGPALAVASGLCMHGILMSSRGQYLHVEVDRSSIRHVESHSQALKQNSVNALESKRLELEKFKTEKAASESTLEDDSH